MSEQSDLVVRLKDDLRHVVLELTRISRRLEDLVESQVSGEPQPVSSRQGEVTAVREKVASLEARGAGAGACRDVQTVVRRVVAQEAARLCNCEPEHVRETFDLAETLGLDALGRIELCLAVEKRLGVPALASAEVRTVGDVVRAAAALAGARG